MSGLCSIVSDTMPLHGNGERRGAGQILKPRASNGRMERKEKRMKIFQLFVVG